MLIITSLKVSLRWMGLQNGGDIHAPGEQNPVERPRALAVIVTASLSLTG